MRTHKFLNRLFAVLLLISLLLTALLWLLRR